MLSSPKPAGAACAACPVRDARCLVPARITGPRRLVVVGESPNRRDLESGEIGSVERVLKRALGAQGLAPSEVHWTNAVLCQCRPEDLKKAAKACRKRLAQELAASGAPVVVPLGSLGVAGAVGKPAAHQKWRGSVTPSEAGNWLVAPIVNPLMALRAERWRPLFESDVARVGRVLRGGFRPLEEFEGRTLTILRRPEQLAELEALGPEVSGDVETVGLGPTETDLVCLGFSDGARTLVLPWSSSNNGRDPHWAFPGRTAEVISRMLSTRVMISQNGPAFDHIVMARYGMRIGRWGDTLLAAHALQSHMPKGLAALATTWLDVSAWKQAESRSADLEELMRYNGKDCLYTILIWRELQARLK